MGNYWWQTDSPARPSGRKKKGARTPSAQPSLTFQLSTPEEAEGAVESYRVGDLCPNCGFAPLAYDGYFNVYCPICGFRTGARGACT